MDLPLTVKELTELAARKRTYFFRALFVAGLAFWFHFDALYDAERNLGDGAHPCWKASARD